jgi:hypothetical protein
VSPRHARCGHVYNPLAEILMRSILLWMLGIPIPIIILIALFAH